MVIALLADIHANLVALEAVLREVPSAATLWVMGDTVGYGPDPTDVLALLRERSARLVAGNHDLAVAGRIDVHDFNIDAAEAALMHRSWLGAEDRDRLAALPLIREEDGFALVHGSLREPVWEYVLDPGAARACLELAKGHCCNGHTHLPVAYALEDGRVTTRQPQAGEVVPLATAARLLINPGSVGQPRDGDARAAWALLDLEARTITFRRSAYDIVETQRRIRARKLPGFLADRLAFGM